MRVEPLTPEDTGTWLALRQCLWPNTGADEHLAEIAALLANVDTLQILVRDTEGAALGFAEAGLRRDHVNGTDTSPVAFLEGIFVVPQARGCGVARALAEAAETWARQMGCSEFASDAPADNTGSHAMHRALGFEETERVVFFRKILG